MSGRMSGGRNHPNARDDLELAIEELDTGTGKVEPLRRRVRVLVPAFVFNSLHKEWRLRKDGVLAAVVEVKVRVDHPADVRGVDVVLAEFLCDRGVDRAVILDQRQRRAIPSVDQPGAGGMLDQ